MKLQRTKIDFKHEGQDITFDVVHDVDPNILSAYFQEWYKQTNSFSLASFCRFVIYQKEGFNVCLKYEPKF